MAPSCVRLTRADLILAAQTRAALRSGAARRAREASGLTGAEVARSLGVSAQAVSAWETGRASPNAAHARDYGKLLAGLAPTPPELEAA